MILNGGFKTCQYLKESPPLGAKSPDLLYCFTVLLLMIPREQCVLKGKEVTSKVSYHHQRES